ncbi:MAG: hypothetical protein LQ342_005004 [Letrouitia transgressa]|nr:MAG: hypothetical protein LQ342_005004 [Letrouitia transgressa]
MLVSALKRIGGGTLKAWTSLRSVARQTVTAPSRRPPGSNNVFTAFLSSAVLAAAVIDSSSKNARKKEWNDAIAKARDHLEALKCQQERRLASLTQPIEEEEKQGKEEDEKEKLLGKEEKYGEEGDQTWVKLFNWSQRQLQLRKELGFEAWKGLPLNRLEKLSTSDIERFIQHHSGFFRKFIGKSGADLLDDGTPRQFWMKKLKTLEWSVAGMVLRLISNQRYPSNYDTHILISDRLKLKKEQQNIQHHLDALRLPLMPREGDDVNSYSAFCHEVYRKYPSPTRPLYSNDPRYDLGEIDSLNSKLDNCFDAALNSPGGVNDVLLDICSLLMYSPVPPNIHTYNTLLLGFAEAGRYDLFPPVLQSITESHVMPNEITTTQSLQYYIQAGDRRGFQAYTEKMQGLKEGMALHWAKIPIPELVDCRYTGSVLVDAGKGNLRRVPFQDWSQYPAYLRSKQTRSRLKIKEKARYNQEVYYELIRGSLHFNNPHDTMQYFHSMVDEGWKPNQKIMICILENCALSRSWVDGIAVWQQLQSMEEEPSERSIISMIYLCFRCRRLSHIWHLLLMGVRERLLPETSLEISLGKWIKIMRLDWWDAETKTHFQKTLDIARTSFTLKQKLKGLVKLVNSGAYTTLSESLQISTLALQLSQALDSPNPETRALLEMADVISTTSEFQRKYWPVDCDIQLSHKSMLCYIGEIHQILSRAMISKLERRVDLATSSASRCINDNRRIFLTAAFQNFSVTLRELTVSMQKLIESLSIRIFAHQVQGLTKRLQILVSQTEQLADIITDIPLTKLKVWYERLCNRTEDLRKEARASFAFFLVKTHRLRVNDSTPDLPNNIVPDNQVFEDIQPRFCIRSPGTYSLTGRYSFLKESIKSITDEISGIFGPTISTTSGQIIDPELKEQHIALETEALSDPSDNVNWSPVAVAYTPSSTFISTPVAELDSQVCEKAPMLPQNEHRGYPSKTLWSNPLSFGPAPAPISAFASIEVSNHQDSIKGDLPPYDKYVRDHPGTINWSPLSLAPTSPTTSGSASFLVSTSASTDRDRAQDQKPANSKSQHEPLNDQISNIRWSPIPSAPSPASSPSKVFAKEQGDQEYRNRDLLLLHEPLSKPSTGTQSSRTYEVKINCDMRVDGIKKPLVLKDWQLDMD